MGLSGQQRKQLQEALIDAFPTTAYLERMLAYGLDKNLRAIAGEGSLQDIIFKLIQTANSEEWVEDLVRTARDSNPGNQQLRIIAEGLPNSATETPPSIPQKQTHQVQKILILAAIPHGLRSDKEIREIEEAIRRATNRNLFEIKVRTAVRPADIRRAIAEEQPSIVHFCGHGLEDGSLLLEDDGGNDKPVAPSSLASLFKLHADYVKCVLLNACYSEKPAVAISQYINYVIGMNNPIQDGAAIEFAKGFYDGVGYKTSNNQDIFQRAFDEGMIAIEMENVSQGTIPVLITRLTIPLRIRELIEKSYSQGETILDLSNQGIEELPSEIRKLTKLKELDLSGNTLTQLPIEIGHLTNLEVLKLSGNRLTNLPKSFADLQKLNTLDLSDNQLSLVPAEITTLKHLKAVNLRSNHLVNLPDDVVNLVNLTTFYISENRLTQLPVRFSNLKQLTSLDISRNQFNTLPIEISYLTKLRELIVSGNRLSDLPSSLRELIYLEELDVSRNRLSSVPNVITQLTSLLSLNLRENKLTDLPNNLVNLRNLISINVEENPFAKLPDNFTKIIEPSRLFNYLLERAKGEDIPLREAKLLIVGEAAVGKTSLINRLVYNTYNPNENTTKGISIVPWEISINDIRVKINIWDFGGQEIMHATHQFFLTKRSIYALVLDSRRGEHESRLEYWLKLIRSFGGNSPILVICNKADQNQVELDWTGLQRKYGISDYVRAVSCETGQGIDGIKKVLAEVITKLKYINDPLPTNWLVVKSKIQNIREDYLSYERYKEIANSNGIKDIVSQENLLRYLHDLGVVLWFGEDLRLNNTNVLNPEWVTRAIYQILNSNLAFQQKGRLKINQLQDILDEQKYPKEKHPFIIDMMKHFELCFSFDNFQEETVLIPDLLEKNQTYTGDWNESLLFQIHYDVLPGSIISRFIVRMHTYALQETYWRNGIVLEDKDNNTKALVRADSTERKIFIKVIGLPNRRRRFLEVIRSNFRSIHESISNLGAIEWVPIPGTDAVLSYESLLKNEQHKIDRFIPPNMNEPVSVSELLDGVDPPEKRLKESYFTARSFETPVPVKLRELLTDLVDKLITIPAADSFEGRTTFLLNIPDSDSLNRSTTNARTDISLLVQQLRERKNQFSQDHPLHILIDNAWQYVKSSPLGQDLVSLRERIKEVFEELYNEQQ